MPDPSTKRAPNIDHAQVKRFGERGDWAKPDGPWRALHDINPARIQFISEAAARLAPSGLRGLRLLDLGCGGGILSAALAQLGAEVTAIDADSHAIAEARRTAHARGLDIDYRHESADAHQPQRPYDCIACCELIEHVPDPARLIADCARLARPGALVVLATLTRSLASFAGAIVAAEYLLNTVPRGTHRYIDFIRPSELEACASQHGMRLVSLRGLSYNPFTRRARLERRIRINYLAAFERQ